MTSGNGGGNTAQHGRQRKQLNPKMQGIDDDPRLWELRVRHLTVQAQAQATPAAMGLDKKLQRDRPRLLRLD